MTSQGSNAYIDDISNLTESPVFKNEDSKVVQFFAHTNVLVTGGTGFLGKLLIEKLLRSCPDITTLFMFVRSKKEKSIQERFQENFEDIIYDRLRREQPDFLKKVVLIDGDITVENFDLPPEVLKSLMSTNIIFHAAATVRFHEKLRVAANINVKSIKNLLSFAKQLPNLKAFVHISTAFSFCVNKFVDEKHYKVPIEVEKLLSLLNILDDDQLEHIAPVITGDWPNMYTFSKALGENTVLTYSSDLPVCIVRPSIVTSTSAEPIAAWTNNMYGATGVAMGAGVGLLRTLHCVPEYVADVIPADYVIANIIASAWDVADRKSLRKLELNSNISDEEKIPIYNCVSSCQNPISWREFMDANAKYGVHTPSTKCIWYYMLILNRHLFVHHIFAFFLHYIPAVIVDTACLLCGKKPMLLDAYKKVDKFSGVINFFCTHEWRFANDNVMKLWEKLEPVDREIFKFNTKNLDWEKYCYHHIKGLRVYLLNDPLDTLEESRKKFAKLRVMHYTLLTLFWLLVAWIVISFLSFMWSFCPLAH